MAKLQSVNSVAGKETIYVDVDDEITAIIDKVGDAKGKVVALVLPKRCPVLQSVVNMKLLKRTAESNGKHLVLVTSEAGLMPLAGATGLYVASTPTSKPSVPEAADIDTGDSEDIEEPLDIVDGNASDSDDFDAKAAAGMSIGELATAGAKDKDDDDDNDDIDPIDLNDREKVAANDVKPSKLKVKVKKDKKLKVPNFDRFRKRMVLAVLGVAILVAAWIFAFNVLPKAAVTINTDSSMIPTNLTLDLKTSATKLDVASNTVPATSQSEQKTASQTVPATGQQNNGQKASGSVDLTQSVCAPNLGQQPSSIPTGSSVTSGGKTYITQQQATYTFDKFTSGNCAQYNTGSVDIVALAGGSNYNTASGATFSGPDSATGTGSASGGTDNILTIVQQSDIDTATGKITSANTDSVKQQLESDLEAKGLLPVPVTFLAGAPKVTSSAKVGDQASNVTVTAVTTYTMLGVKKTDLQTLVKNNVEGQLDKGKQVILNDGVANAQFGEAVQGTDTTATVAMSTKSLAGPRLDAAALKTELAGKKSGDVKNYIKQTPGVTGVSVKLSPFWVNTVPKKAAKVQITIVKAGN